MSHSSADVLILRSVPHGESDRLVSALSADEGRMFVVVKGAGSIRRRETAATEPYTWCNMELYLRNGAYWMKNASVIESFYGLRYDMDKLFLAAYIADVVYELSDEGTPAGEILPLALNTYHKLAQKDADVACIKAAFELRAACIAGFTPELTLCERCHGHVQTGGYLDVMNGAVTCAPCFVRAQNALPVPAVNGGEERRLLLPLDATALSAMHYVCTADAKRVFAFRITDGESVRLFSTAAEAYLLNHLERGFDTLENYKKLAAFAPPQ